MKLKIYEYKNCGTCKKALKYLDAKKVAYEKIPIRETPPSLDELTQMMSYVGIKKLFNTSGQDYRQLGLKDKLPKMSEQEMLNMLSHNGNLVKRPFILGKNFGLVGFNEDLWKKSIKL